MDNKARKILNEYIECHIKDENLENERAIMGFELSRLIHPLLADIVNQEHMQFLLMYKQANIIDNVRLQMKSNDCCLRNFRMCYEYKEHKLPELYKPCGHGPVVLLLQDPDRILELYDIITLLDSEKREFDTKMKQAYRQVVDNAATLDALFQAWPESKKILEEKQEKQNQSVQKAIEKIRTNESAKKQKGEAQC